MFEPYILKMVSAITTCWHIIHTENIIQHIKQTFINLV